MLDEEAMRLFSFPEEHHEFVKRLHFVKTNDMQPSQIHEAYLVAGLNYYHNINVMPPRDFQRLVLWAMLSVDSIDEGMLTYVSKLI